MAIIRDDLRYLLFGEIYLKFEEPRAKRKAYALLEASIQCFARKGLDHVTTQMVAREAGVSRPLIHHYFKNVAEMQVFALKYIRVLYQRLVVDSLSKQPDAEKMLAAYVRASLVWTQTLPSHANVWISFLQRCGRDGKRRKLNTEAVSVGTQRIETLIQQGIEQGIFHCTDVKRSARTIQVLITGSVLSLVAEDFIKPEEFIQLIVSQALRCVSNAK